MNDLYFSPLLLSLNLMASSALACTALWYYSRPYRGPGVWTCGVLIVVMGLLLLLGNNPLAQALGGTLQATGEAVLVMGVFRYLGLPPPWWVVPTSAGIIGMTMAWHGWIRPLNSEALVAVSSVSSTLLSALACGLLWSGPGEPELRGVRRFVALTFACYSAINLTSGLIAALNSLRGVEYANEEISVAYLLPINFGVPLWALTLIGLSLLTMRRILLDSQRNARRFERLMSVTNAGIVVLRDDHIVDANPEMESLFTCSHDDLMGRSLTELFEVDGHLVEQVSSADGRPQDRQALREDGSRFAAELSVALMGDGSQVAEIRDVSARKALEEELRRLASRDPLTGALNRRAFAERADHELARRKRQGNALCLAVFDLDHFKQINDRHGHAMGDQVLQAFSQHCREQLRHTDLFARFGGEEFVLLLPDTDEQQASTLLERLREGWAQQVFATPLGSLQVTVSIGLVRIDADPPLELWVERADAALYQAKSAGRNRLAIA